MWPTIELPVWPSAAEVAVCLTFDVDAEAPWLAQSPEYARRLSTLSEGRYGVVRALPRILELLRRHELKATFYVPGSTADRHPDSLHSILMEGHEVGHHGHLHLRTHHLDADAQRAEMEQGLEALARIAGCRPRGYRSPAWELTPETLSLLVEHGFVYDSSCMGDDRPYVEQLGGDAILELPVHWSLDDWPYYGWSVEAGGNLFPPSMWLESWLAEFDTALRERRIVTYTMHPEVVGRGYRFTALERLLELKARADVWFATQAEVAGLCERGSSHAPGVAQPQDDKRRQQREPDANS
jgi:peptidoglycan/xylan/chitin deacetylase (PgdA/CDA1 family)